MKYTPLFHVVLHSPEIPQNTGAIGRTCVALQAKLWLVRPLGFRMDDRTLRRAGLDYWQHLNWEVAHHWQELTDRLQEKRYWYFSRFANKSFREVSFKSDDVLVFGSETAGLPLTITRDQDSRMLRIPTRSVVRSLNLASAVAVAGYELQRQIEVK